MTETFCCSQIQVILFSYYKWKSFSSVLLDFFFLSNKNPLTFIDSIAADDGKDQFCLYCIKATGNNNYGQLNHGNHNQGCQRCSHYKLLCTIPLRSDLSIFTVHIHDFHENTLVPQNAPHVDIDFEINCFTTGFSFGRFFLISVSSIVILPSCQHWTMATTVMFTYSGA